MNSIALTFHDAYDEDDVEEKHVDCANQKEKVEVACTVRKTQNDSNE